MTLPEVLLALVILAMGLTFVMSSLPVMLKDSSEARDRSECAAIALCWYSLLRSLPHDCTSSEVAAAFSELLGDPGSDFAPSLSPVNPILVFSEPQSGITEFADSTTGQGEYSVAILFCDSVGGVPGRAYNICVRRIGGVWNCYPFIRSGER